MLFDFDNTFARRLEGFYAPQDPEPVSDPVLLRVNHRLASDIGIDPFLLESGEAIRVLAGNSVPDGAMPLAQAYAGHQFGGFAPQLGDGRAVLLGEIVTPGGDRVDIVLKGSGRTPFSRGGDGRAALGPVLREYVVGEAMHALGIPTTRALAAVATGETVRRDRPLPGAVLTRVASSHLRVGTFQFFASRGLSHLVEPLVAYAIERHCPEVAEADNPALAFLAEVVDRQAELVALWMHVGFVHGVMNTDNTTISGETIDYGPCAFVEHHDPNAVFSSIDTHGRYAYGRQPLIMQWNLARLAESLLPSISDDSGSATEMAGEIVDGFTARFRHHWDRQARHKLGLVDERPDDAGLAHDWVGLLAANRMDHTRSWRLLGDPADLAARLAEVDGGRQWLDRWTARTGDDPQVTCRVRAANPRIVPRNHLVEAALDDAVEGDLSTVDRLLSALQDPFDDDPQFDDLAEPAPDGFIDSYRTYCGT